MQTDEIVRLTRWNVAELVRARRDAERQEHFLGRERRHTARWPFPGTVELWPTESDGRERWFATCRNLSPGGLGLLAEDPFEPGMPVEIACHFPEATLCGRATIQHCTETPHGFLVGLKFEFDQ